MSLERFVAAADNHGDHICRKTENEFFDFIDAWKPKHRLHLGDLFDFRALRRKANENEKRESILEDVSIGKEFLQEYRPNVWVMGNHDDRLFEIARWGSGAVRDLAEVGCQDIISLTKKVKCNVVPFGKRAGVYPFGDMKLLHGYFAGSTAAARHAAIYGKCMFGHVHAYDVASIARWEGPVIATGIPALCILDQEYNQQTPGSLRHSNGWAYGVIDSKTGETETWVAKKIGDKWVFPTI